MTVKTLPDNLMYRQCLRGCQRKKYQDAKRPPNPTPSKVDEIRIKIDVAREMKNWAEMDRLAEMGLALDPWDSQFSANLGEAAFELGYLEVAVFAYEQATAPNGDPRNKVFLTP